MVLKIRLLVPKEYYALKINSAQRIASLRAFANADEKSPVLLISADRFKGKKKERP